MGKFDLQVSNEHRAPVPNASPAQKTKPDWGGYVPQVLDLAKAVMNGRHDIDVIETNADAECRRIEAEAKRIVLEAQANILKTREENVAWHSRFDKKAEICREVFRQIQAMDESDEIKARLIDAAQELLRS